MPTCVEVTRAIASDAVVDAGWKQRLGVWMHLLKCPACRRYLAQIRAIGTAIQGLFRPQDEDPQTLERLQSAILGQPKVETDSKELE